MGLSEKRAKGLGTPKRTGALGVSDQRLQNMEALSRGWKVRETEGRCTWEKSRQPELTEGGFQSP